MGRHRVKIELIEDERMRQLMFLKRKQIINRKLYELAVVCGCEISCIYFTSDDKMWEFSSTGNTDEILIRYANYASPHEIRSISDYERMNGEDPAISEFDLLSRESKETRPAFLNTSNPSVQRPRPPHPINTSQIRDMQWSRSNGYNSMESPDYYQHQQNLMSARSEMPENNGAHSRKRSLIPEHVTPTSARFSKFAQPMFSPTRGPISPTQYHPMSPTKPNNDQRSYVSEQHYQQHQQFPSHQSSPLRQDRPVLPVPSHISSRTASRQFTPPQQEYRSDAPFPAPQARSAPPLAHIRTVLPPPIHHRSNSSASEWTPPSSANVPTNPNQHQILRPTRIFTTPTDFNPENSIPDLPSSPKRPKLSAITKLFTPPGSASDEPAGTSNSPPVVFLEPCLRSSPPTSLYSWK